ncbi:MAG: hypothetical protein HUK23_07500, partial [Sphaerochaetaceae bacterium]|nr:hypothetical protein [Sphaerochaetaceae bacterium]
MFKRLFAVLILILSLCFNIFAESIEIEHADTLYNEDKIYVLKGNVKLSFTSDNGDKSSLNADKISIDLEEKVLEASGNVVLIQDKEEKSFEGSAIVLYWDSVDLIVFDGQSSIDRTNT